MTSYETSILILNVSAETSVAPLEIYTSKNGIWGTYSDEGVPVDQKNDIKIKFDVDYCADMLVFEIFNGVKTLHRY